MKNSW